MKAKFPAINKGYQHVFQPNQLSVGIVVPIEHYPNSVIPTMANHLQRVQQVEKLGFKALWIRDIPFNVPAFGDAGQTFDPFTYLGYLTGKQVKLRWEFPVSHYLYITQYMLLNRQHLSTNYLMEE